jgi:hypothetical protein
MACVGTSLPTLLVAQAKEPDYKGHRAAVFEIRILQIKKNWVELKCRVVNTGRVRLSSQKEQTEVVVELDSINVPAILWGHEQVLSTAVKKNLPTLAPGEISAPVWLGFSVPSPQENTGGANLKCADIQVDTFFISQFGKEDLLIKYVLRNGGDLAANLSNQSSVNFYFISGTRLTRGAIVAGHSEIKIGRESLTGWLLPGQRIQGEAKISLKNRSKFAPNLLMEVVGPADLIECDKTNNTFSGQINHKH